MFRIVKDFVPSPCLLLLCDNPSCGSFATAQMQVDPQPAQVQAAIAPFIEGRKLEGWTIGLDQQLCPQHTQAARHKESLVTVPRLILPN